MPYKHLKVNVKWTKTPREPIAARQLIKHKAHITCQDRQFRLGGENSRYDPDKGSFQILYKTRICYLGKFVWLLASFTVQAMIIPTNTAQK